MKVSVIVPSYNRAAYLPMALESLAAQEGAADLDVIVIDDGSSDDTRERVREFQTACPDLPLRYFYQDHAGISAARNRGILSAEGDWIAFLDSDDLWHPEKLKRQLAYLKEHPLCQIVFARYENFIDLPEGAPDGDQKKITELTDHRYLASALVRKELFETNGPFSPELTVGEDTEWVLRNRILGVDTDCCVEETLYFRRVHEDNISLRYMERTKERIGSIIALAAYKAKLNRRKGHENIGTDTCL